MLESAKITMLGTGSAFVTRCFNTCFVLETSSARLLVDAGGGNAVLSRLETIGLKPVDVPHMFLTHAHTDHVMGAVWVARAMVNAAKKGTFDGEFRIYGHERVLNVLKEICRLTFSAKDFSIFEKHAVFDVLTDGSRRLVGDIDVEFFDIHSTKEQQFGFRAVLPDGKVVVCLGDEPLNDANVEIASNADWLMTEAFCLHKDSDIYKPYEKHHSTALDAGRAAARLNARNLVIYHTEDNALATRRETYAAEAAQEFTGNIVVPDDMDVMRI